MSIKIIILVIIIIAIGVSLWLIFKPKSYDNETKGLPEDITNKYWPSARSVLAMIAGILGTLGVISFAPGSVEDQLVNIDTWITGLAGFLAITGTFWESFNSFLKKIKSSNEEI